MMRYESDSDDGIMGSLVPTTMQSREQILPVSSTISASFGRTNERELILQKKILSFQTIGFVKRNHIS